MKYPEPDDEFPPLPLFDDPPPFEGLLFDEPPPFDGLLFDEFPPPPFDGFLFSSCFFNSSNCF